VNSCPSSFRTSPAGSAPAGPWEVAEHLLVAALPEFLGALAAAFVVAVAASVWRRWAYKRCMWRLAKKCSDK
jgi:hypothetical protein